MIRLQLKGKRTRREYLEQMESMLKEFGFSFVYAESVLDSDSLDESVRVGLSAAALPNAFSWILDDSGITFQRDGSELRFTLQSKVAAAGEE